MPAIHVTYEEARAFLFALMLAQARILAMFSVLPVTTTALMPGPLRYAVAAGIGLIVAPVLAPSMADGAMPDGVEFFALMVKEAAVGFVLGWLVAIPFWAFEAVGFVIDNQRGASIAATINPLTGHDSSPLGILFNQAFIVFFFVTNGFRLLLEVIYDSYLQWNPLTFWPQLTEASAALLFPQLNRLVMIGLLLAAPVIVAMFLSELGLALVSRFVPQLQVFFLAMPIKSALAFLVLILYGTTLFDYARVYVQEMGTWVPRLDPLVRPGR